MEIPKKVNKQLAEQSRLRDLGVQLDLGEAEGAQAAAANAEAASDNAMAQGIQGAIGFGTQALNTMPLYFKDNSKTGATGPLVMGQSTGTNGPGANPAFQSKASDRYNTPTNTSSSPFDSSSQNQNPFGYTKPETQYGKKSFDFSGVGGF